MLSVQACEDLIASAQKFAKAIHAAQQVYTDLPKVIEQEHQIIRDRKIDAMEEIVKQKLSVGQKLEKHINAALDCIFAAREICEQYFVELPKFDLKLSSAIAMYHEIEKEVFKADNFKGQVLAKIIKSCEVNLDEFFQSVDRTKGRIEVNKRLTAELLRHHQESIRFWQDVAMEAEATYTSGGVRKKDQNAGILKVGA